MRRVFFLIRSLDQGGAERQLIELVKSLRYYFQITVATFYQEGALRQELENLQDVQLISLQKKSRWDLVPFIVRLFGAVHKAQPDILHGYLGIANELCLLMGKLLGIKVVWGVRSSIVDFSRYDWMSGLAFRVGAWLSRLSDLIIFNSWAGQQHHIAHGYCGKRMAVVPNGINTERFRPDAESRQRVRTEWGITEDQVLIGLVARLDPMKDHPTFLRAAARVAVLRPNVRFVCVGDGPQTYKRELWSLSEALQLKERLIWAGSRTDIVAVYNALDIAVLSSYGEGFPNVVAEAMACGVPCVVTNVGAAAQIVGPMGVVVQPRDPEALCQGMLTSLCRLTEPGLSQQVRERIVQTFSRERLVCATKELLESLL